MVGIDKTDLGRIVIHSFRSIQYMGLSHFVFTAASNSVIELLKYKIH